MTPARTSRAPLAPLATLALLCLMLSACGQPTVEAVPDISEDDAAAADASAGTDAGGGSDTGGATGPEWHDGGKVPFTVTGLGQIEVEDHADPADMRAIKLLMFQTPKPDAGKVYVWWMRSPLGKAANYGVLPYEDVPYVPDFSVSVADPGDGSPPHIQNFNGAFITYEDEVGADTMSSPVGPLVWKGEIPKGAWVHVQHVLTDWQGDKGFIAQAQVIMAQVDKELGLARDGVKAKKPNVARRHVENIHTLLVGAADANDLDGDQKVIKDLVPYTMGLAKGETPLNDALKHAKFAEDAAKSGDGNTDGLETGVLVLGDAVKGFNDKLISTIETCSAFASSTSKDFKLVDQQVTFLVGKFNEALKGAQKLGQINLAP